MFSTITSKLGIHVHTTTHDTRPEAEKDALASIDSGSADSAAIWTEADNAYGSEQVACFGTGR